MTSLNGFRFTLAVLLWTFSLKLFRNRSVLMPFLSACNSISSWLRHLCILSVTFVFLHLRLRIAIRYNLCATRAEAVYRCEDQTVAAHRRLYQPPKIIFRRIWFMWRSGVNSFTTATFMSMSAITKHFQAWLSKSLDKCSHFLQRCFFIFLAAFYLQNVSITSSPNSKNHRG